LTDISNQTGLFQPWVMAVHEIMVLYEIEGSQKNLTLWKICLSLKAWASSQYQQNRNSFKSLIHNLDVCSSLELIRWVTRYFHFSDLW
jgi:hypothetical protein